MAEAFGPEAVASQGDYRIALAVENAGEENVHAVAKAVHRAILQCRSDAGIMIVGAPLIGSSRRTSSCSIELQHPASLARTAD